MVSVVGGAVKSFFYAGSLGKVMPPRWAYLIQLILGMFGVLLVKLWGAKFPDWIFGFKDEMVRSKFTIIIFMAFFFYHLILCISLIGVSSCSEKRSRIHNCFWPIKAIAWGLFALFIWLSTKQSQKMLIFFWIISLTFGCLFLIAEGFAVICVSSSLNEMLVEKVADEKRGYLYVLLGMMILFSVSFILLTLFYGFSDGRPASIFFLFINFLVLLLQLGTVAIPSVRAANSKANITFILATALFSLFLFTSGLECTNIKTNAKFYGEVGIFIHLIFLLIALFHETLDLVKEKEESQSVLSVPTPSVATSDEATKSSTESPSSTIDAPNAKAGGDEDEDFEDFCYSKQHLLYCFISALLVPVFCNWNLSSFAISGRLSCIFSLIAYGIVHLLVFWVLLAPLILSSREF